MEKAGPHNNWHYNKKLKPLASSLRQDMTKAEACLWKYVLRNGSMEGYTFHRQRALLNYIVDFMCKDLMLVIEVDGITHQDEEVYKKDCLRDEALEQIGFQVIRFHDDEVLNDINNVIRTIEAYIEMYNKKQMNK